MGALILHGIKCIKNGNEGKSIMQIVRESFPNKIVI